MESPAPHIICRCAPASLAPTTVVGSRMSADTLPASLFDSASATMPGVEVVLEHPVGEHVRRVAAAGGDHVGERAAEEALLAVGAPT